jgi:Uma2 family endonuclease
MRSTIATRLAEFLAQPNIEASPAWEFINGTARQKIMPTLYHSRLQRNLVNWINQNTDRYEAIQKLRCIISPISNDILPGLTGLPNLNVAVVIVMTQQRSN